MRESALDKKGEGFAALDVGGRTILADTFAIVTGRSKIQTRAIADAIVESAKEQGYATPRVEGYADGSWILIDLGNIIVHVFTPEQRQFYNLERLWTHFPNAASSVGDPNNFERRSANAARPPAEPGPPNAASSIGEPEQRAQSL